MNAVFWFLVVLALVFLWFLCSFIYKAIGGFFLRLFSDARDVMMDDDEKHDERKD